MFAQATNMIELNSPATEMDWIVLVLLVTIVYLVFRK